MKIIFIFCINVLLLMQVKALEVTTTFTADNLKGNTATFRCEWTVTGLEVPGLLYIFRNNTSLQCSLPYPPDSCRPINDFPIARYKPYFNSNTSISLNITNVQCSDQGLYTCSVYVISPSLLTVNSSAVLNIKVPPGPPTLSNPQLEVQENSNFTANCSASLGYPNPFKIVWRAYKNGQIDSSVNLIDTAVNVTRPGDDVCTTNTVSTVYLKADRKHQNITLACFVTNLEAPQLCTNPTSDLCSQTSPVNVTYGVTVINLGLPTSTVYEGNKATLTCYSEGNPPPTYTWVKENDENRTLEIKMVDSVSTLTIPTVNISEDTGTYNCTASNVVNSVTYRKSDSKYLAILAPTTTTPTTTTKRTTTLTTPTSGSTAGTGPAGASIGSDDNTNDIIIGVVVGVGGALIIAIIIAIVCYRRRANKPKTINEAPAEKTYNNNSSYNINLANSNNLNYKSPQPDVVASDKKMNSSSLNSSFDFKNDGLTYADLTYDNRPRSRKPMAITDNGSIYSSEIQMPEV